MSDYTPDKAVFPPAAGTGPYTGPQEPTFSGAASFMRRPYARDLAGVDIAVTGLPLDLMTTGRPGARFGPRGVRNASTNIAWGKPFPWGFDPFAILNVIDYGDARVAHGEQAPDGAPVPSLSDQLQAHLDPIVSAGVVPLSLGGDHFVSYPVLKTLFSHRGEPVSLIHFDAHSDTWPEGVLDHGTMFYYAAHEGLVDPAHSVQIGLRTWNDHDYGYNVLTSPWVQANGIAATIDAVRRFTAGRPVYITFDIDCLDPAFAPGTGTPVPGGLTCADALAIIRGLTGLDYTGFDVVEVSPPYDHAEVTALAGAQIALEFICLMADARAKSQTSTP